MRRFFLILYFSISFFVDLVVYAAPASCLVCQELAEAERYFDLIHIALQKSANGTCSLSCQREWLFNAGRAALKMGDYEGASFYFERARQDERDSLSYLKLRGYSAILLGERHRAEQIVQVLQKKSLEEATKFRALTLVAGTDRQQSTNRRILGQLLETVDSQEIVGLGQAYQRKKLYSPTLAGWLGLIPGAGFAYLGLWQSAVLSFGMTGVTFMAARELYRHRLPWVAASAGFVSSVFYIGGMLASAKSATEMNDGLLEETRKKITSWALPELEFKWVF